MKMLHYYDNISLIVSAYAKAGVYMMAASIYKPK